MPRLTPRLVLLAALLAFTQNVFAIDQLKVLSALQTVVMVRGYNDTGGLSYGSGVVVAQNKVMTNCHILRSTKQPWVARGEDTYDIISVQADRWHDLCLVTTVNLPFKPANIVKNHDLKRGQEIISIGHSNGAPSPLTSAGIINASYIFEGGRVIRSSAAFRMGASGSGIFDTEGNLLGINTFKTPGRTAYFYSLPIEWLADIEKLPVETTFPIIGKAFWEEDDDKKPFFMQIALPEINQDWPKLAKVAHNWIDIDPKNSDAWYELGKAQENMEKTDEAKVSYKKSVALDASNTDSLFRLGAIAQSTGDTATVRDINVAIANISKDLAQEYSQMLGCKTEC
ncbi:MAG: trypsin-like peptidase domain-containing protein [Methylotenera sp.]|uniref:trypsin-like peptidase domain-containing protein n=1 Tax=Methylotenera sp. TaxID=2051956 RepID=UPI002489A558|nr:trypsin-like peptidase domain-containing protein [Methylotenera sp.]MDI1309487.1 trypsin-like peptidase domain-containing protein [Methylotenera sp.]